MFRAMCWNICLVCIALLMMQKTSNRGVSMVKHVLADNFVRPDEAEKIKSKIRERGHYNPEFGISDCRFSCYARFPIGAYYICPPNNMDGKMQNCKVQMKFTL